MIYPEDVYENLGIDEEAEYRGHFSMEATRLFHIFDALSQTPAANVRINLDSEKVVFSLDGLPALDPALMNRVECFLNPKPLEPENGMEIEIEDQVENVENVVCWRCLLEYVQNINAVHIGIWNRVFLYMGEDGQTVIQNRVPAGDFLGLLVPGPNHIHDLDEDGNEDGNEGGNEGGIENGHADGNEGGNENGHADGNEGGFENGHADGNEGGIEGGIENGHADGNEGGNEDGHEVIGRKRARQGNNEDDNEEAQVV